MSIAPTLYDYHGKMISIKEGAELAYITPEALRQRLKKVGGTCIDMCNWEWRGFAEEKT